MDFSALIANNNKVLNRKYNDAVSGQNVVRHTDVRPHYLTETYFGAFNEERNFNLLESQPKRNAAQHVAEQLDRARIAHEEAARTRAYNNRTKK